MFIPPILLILLLFTTQFSLAVVTPPFYRPPMSIDDTPSVGSNLVMTIHEKGDNPVPIMAYQDLSVPGSPRIKIATCQDFYCLDAPIFVQLPASLLPGTTLEGTNLQIVYNPSIESIQIYSTITGATGVLITCENRECSQYSYSVINTVNPPDSNTLSLKMRLSPVSNLPSFIYSTNNNELRFFQCNDIKCENLPTQVLLGTGTPNLGIHNTFEFDSQSRPIFCYTNYSAGASGETQLSFGRCDNPGCSSWTKRVIQEESPTFGIHQAMGILPNDNPVFWYEWYEGDVWVFASCNDPLCNSIGFTNYTGFGRGYTTISVDPVLGTPILPLAKAWTDGFPQVLDCTNAACSSSNIITLDKSMYVLNTNFASQVHGTSFVISWKEYPTSSVWIMYFERLTQCPPETKVLDTPSMDYCIECPDRNDLGLWNPNNSVSESCTFSIDSLCPPRTFINMSAIPIPSCQACPADNDTGTFNLNASLSSNCTFSAFALSDPHPLFDEENPLYIAAPAGLLLISLSFVAFFRRRNMRNKNTVIYRPVDLTIGTNNSTFGATGTQKLTKDTFLINSLALDGGGIRGIVLVTILKEIERISGMKPQNLFHLIGGTSTGGLLSLGLSDSSLSTDQMLDLYSTLGSKIFGSRQLPIIKYIKQIFGSSIYDGEKLSLILQGIFGDTLLFDHDSESYSKFPKVFAVATLSSVRPPVEYLFRTYTIDGQGSYQGASPDHNLFLWEAARATCAAPIFFHEFQRDTFLFADGALFHNNPSRIVFREAASLFPGSKFCLFLSLGTGQVDGSSSQKGRSNLGWLKTLASIATNSERSHRELVSELDPRTYYRLNPPLPYNIPLDSASSSSIKLIRMVTDAYLAEEETQITIDSIHSQISQGWSFLKPKLPGTILGHTKSSFIGSSNGFESYDVDNLLNELEDLRKKRISLEKRISNITRRRKTRLLEGRGNSSASSRGSEISLAKTSSSPGIASSSPSRRPSRPLVSSKPKPSLGRPASSGTVSKPKPKPRIGRPSSSGTVSKPKPKPKPSSPLGRPSSSGTLSKPKPKPKLPLGRPSSSGTISKPKPSSPLKPKPSSPLGRPSSSGTISKPKPSSPLGRPSSSGTISKPKPKPKPFSPLGRPASSGTLSKPKPKPRTTSKPNRVKRK